MPQGDCTKARKGTPGRRRAVIAAVFAKGNIKAAARHRLFQCYHASPCGRACERFVKAQGKALVWCEDPETGERTLLYPALEDPNFRCPDGRF